MNLKELFSKKSGPSAPIAINKIWILEVIAAGIFLVSFLFIDFWVYNNIFLQKSVTLSGDVGGVVYLKKTNLVEAGKKIKAYQDFLDNPQYPLIKNPF